MSPFEGLPFLVDFDAGVRLDLRDGVGTPCSDSRESATEFMQYLSPVGGGPSWKT